MADHSSSLHRNRSSSTSFSKRLSSGNGFTRKTIYDDVFAGPRKSGLPTFSARLEDYSEIFGGSRGSRNTSIPILDLPEIPLDVRSSKVDYSEVFGSSGDVDFAVPFEEVAGESKGGESSSEEAW